MTQYQPNVLVISYINRLGRYLEKKHNLILKVNDQLDTLFLNVFNKYIEKECIKFVINLKNYVEMHGQQNIKNAIYL